MTDKSEAAGLRAPLEMFGLPMHPWTMAETLGEIERRLEQGERTEHVVVNVAKVVTMLSDRELCDAVTGCDIINIDGMGLVFGARVLGFDVPERVAGVDLFHELLRLAARKGEGVFLLGAKPEVIEKVAETLQAQMPDLAIKGWHHGYFWDDEPGIVRRIKESGATMLFVAISSPKKEQFIARWSADLGVTFMMGVGGTFDIVAGLTKRAPGWMQAMGLEWFYRLVQEPRRMWRRYLTTNMRFGWLILWALLTDQRISR